MKGNRALAAKADKLKKQNIERNANLRANAAERDYGAAKRAQRIRLWKHFQWTTME